MNGRERVAAALAGETPDTAPVMLHNFLMAAREAGVSMARYRRDPETIARVFTEAVERYRYDGVVVDVDTATLAGAVGVPVLFPDEVPAIAHGRRLQSLAEVRELAPPNLAAYPGIQVWLEAARLLAARLGGEVFIRGNCDQCPFSLAAAMRGSADWMIDILDPEQEDDVRLLLDYCCQVTASFLRLMAATGVHMLSNGDSPAGPSVVSPSIYRRLAQPYEARIVEVSHSLGLPYLLHICGKTDAILGDMAATGADALELDYKTDAVRAREAFRGRAAFTGNIDPTGVLAAGTVAEVESATRDLLRVFAGEPRFLLNAGCAIPETTPPENLHALIRTARTFAG